MDKDIGRGSCFMEPILKMSATSTLKDSTEASVGPMVSGYTIALEGKEGYDRAKFAIYLRSWIEI